MFFLRGGSHVIQFPDIPLPNPKREDLHSEVPQRCCNRSGVSPVRIAIGDEKYDFGGVFSGVTKDLRGLLEGALGVGATTPVGDGRDLAAEQRALVLVRAAGGDVIHARHHVVLGREGDDGHARGRGHHGEVGQQLAHELELVEEVGLAHAGRLVHQEDQLQAAAELPQAPHAAPERAAQTLHFAPRCLLLTRCGRHGQSAQSPRRGLGEQAEAEVERRGHGLEVGPARHQCQSPATKGQARPHPAGDRAVAPESARRQSPKAQRGAKVPGLSEGDPG